MRKGAPVRSASSIAARTCARSSRMHVVFDERNRAVEAARRQPMNASRLLDQVTRSDAMSHDQTPILADSSAASTSLVSGKNRRVRVRRAHRHRRAWSVRPFWRARAQLWSLRQSGRYASGHDAHLRPRRSSQPRSMWTTVESASGAMPLAAIAARSVAATTRRSAPRLRRNRCCSRQSAAATQPSGSFGSLLCGCSGMHAAGARQRRRAIALERAVDRSGIDAAHRGSRRPTLQARRQAFQESQRSCQAAKSSNPELSRMITTSPVSRLIRRIKRGVGASGSRRTSAFVEIDGRVCRELRACGARNQPAQRR